MSDLLNDVEKVLKERNEDYGEARTTFVAVASLWSSILGFEIKASDVAMCLAALKFCREQVNPKKDNVVDLIGYLSLYYDLIDHKATPPPAGNKV